MTPKMKSALAILACGPIIVTMGIGGKVTSISTEGVSISTLKALVNRDLVTKRLLSLSKDIYEVAK